MLKSALRRRRRRAGSQAPSLCTQEAPRRLPVPRSLRQRRRVGVHTRPEDARARMTFHTARAAHLHCSSSSSCIHRLAHATRGGHCQRVGDGVAREVDALAEVEPGSDAVRARRRDHPGQVDVLGGLALLRRARRVSRHAGRRSARDGAGQCSGQSGVGRERAAQAACQTDANGGRGAAAARAPVPPVRARVAWRVVVSDSECQTHRDAASASIAPSDWCLAVRCCSSSLLMAMGEGGGDAASIARCRTGGGSELHPGLSRARERHTGRVEGERRRAAPSDDIHPGPSSGELGDASVGAGERASGMMEPSLPPAAAAAAAVVLRGRARDRALPPQPRAAAAVTPGGREGRT